jgi:hypothetical protein
MNIIISIRYNPELKTKLVALKIRHHTSHLSLAINLEPSIWPVKLK